MRQLATWFVGALLTTVSPLFAQDSHFVRLNLSGGVSIEIPKHWKVLSADSTTNLAAMSEALMQQAQVERSQSRKITVLAVNATPDPTGAIVRVTISVPPDFTRQELRTVTAADLRAIKSEMVSMLRKVEAAGGPRLLEMHDAKALSLAGFPALAIPYVRAGVGGPSPWYVTQYKVPMNNRLVEITLSHRQSDAMIWKPILEKIRQSVRLTE